MRKILCLVVFAMVLSLTCTAWSENLANHATLAGNLKGDMLIYPTYFADAGGWYTKITVINTDMLRDAVAKVVVRGGRYSWELLDFFIFLSPADMWTGYIEVASDGSTVQLRSTDESTLVSLSTPATTANFASVANPFVQPLRGACAGDDVNLGYIEIFEIWSRAEAGPGVTKPTIFGYYAPDQPTTAFACGNDAQLLQPCRPRNILTGSYEIINPRVKVTASNAATVIRDYSIHTKINHSNETWPGDTNAWNNLCEIEAILLQQDVSLPYMNTDSKTTLHTFTFPTKLRAYNPTTCAVSPPRSGFFLTQPNPNPGNVPAYALPYSYDYFDTAENRTTTVVPPVSPQPLQATSYFPREVNIVRPTDETNTPYYGTNNTWLKEFNDLWGTTSKVNYTEGWIQYRFGSAVYACQPVINTDAIQWTNAAPLIATTLFFGTDGLSIMPGAGSIANWSAAADEYMGLVWYSTAGGAYAEAWNYPYQNGVGTRPVY